MEKKSRKIAIISEECVACGCCVKECQKEALFIFRGVKVSVRSELCVGCGACVKVCPASVIQLEERGGEQ